MSTRVDESVSFLLDHLAKKLNTSKKNIVESAIRMYSENVNTQKEINIFKDTCGAWKRDEAPTTAIKNIKKNFNSSYSRRYK